MNSKEIHSIFDQFQHQGKFSSFLELASGHINDTYLVRSEKKPFYVLQRINHGVFKNVPGLIENKVAVSAHIHEKLQVLSRKKQMRRVLSFVKTKAGTSFYKDAVGNYWNLMIFIDKSFTYELVPSKKIAFEAGKLLGEFLTLTKDFDATTLVEVIPKFHDMSFRYEQFKTALHFASKDRLEKARIPIEKVGELKDEMHILQNLKESGGLKLRVTHNDTKISNALFDKKGKGLCLIDTDTVMPGIVHYDFGDAIRTICNTAAEDETNLDLVEFNMKYYKAYRKGFLKKMEHSLTALEKQYLPLSAKTMIFIMALRFLTDYLNNDTYYKTKYPEHNLDRSKNQFKLLQSFTEKTKPIKSKATK
tara:strand:+ start:23529 stop:24614 length:1086 start_codon:yes stop_codon:yes gene_type:complete